MHSYLLGFIEKVAFRSYGEHETQQDALETCLSFTDDFVDRLALKAEERGEFLYESVILLYRETHRQDLIQTIQSYYSQYQSGEIKKPNFMPEHTYLQNIKDYWGTIF